MAQLSDYQNTPSGLGYDIAFSSNQSSKKEPSLKARRTKILSEAYGQLAEQLSNLSGKKETLEVIFDEASAEWTIDIGGKRIATLSDDRSGKGSLDNIILDDYNEFLK